MRNTTRQRGMALVSTMLVLMGLLALILLGTVAGSQKSKSGLMTTTGNGIQMSYRLTQTIAAINLAESGLEYALQWMHNRPQSPSLTYAFPLPGWSGAPGDAGVTYSLPGGTFTVMIYPETDNAASTQKRFLVEAVGNCGGMRQIVRAHVQQSSFGKYAYFVDAWRQTGFWTDGRNTFDGPVHSNNSASALNGNVAYLNNILWHNAAGTQPIFRYTGQDAFTVSGPSINWWLNTTNTTSTPPATDADWAKVSSGGANSVHTNVQTIPMPSNSNTLQYAALGQPIPSGLNPPPPAPALLPTIPGVTLPVGGGIYVHGDIQQITLSVQDQGNKDNQVIAITQNDVDGNPMTTTITLDVKKNETKVEVSGAGKVKYSGLTNGVIYCDGNIGLQTSPKTLGLSGVVADNTVDGAGNVTHTNALTIATDSSKNLNICDNVTYSTARQKDASGNVIPESQDSAFVKNAGTLGIVSNMVQVTEKNPAGATLTNVEVDAAVLAANTYDACNYGGRAIGKFLNMGSYIAGIQGIFSTSYSDGTQASGIAATRLYDNRLADHPPPFFPTTGSNYDVLSWQRVGSTLQ